MTAIQIPDAVRAAVYAHARAAFPAECCGYLVGQRGTNAVEGAVPCRNAQLDGLHPTAAHRGADTGFVIAGAELIRFARSLDGGRPARIVYHSHPNGHAYFSEVDRDVAIGLRGGGIHARRPSYPVEHLVIGIRAEPQGPRVTEAAQFAWSDETSDFIEVARWTVEP